MRAAGQTKPDTPEIGSYRIYGQTTMRTRHLQELRDARPLAGIAALALLALPASAQTADTSAAKSPLLAAFAQAAKSPEPLVVDMTISREASPDVETAHMVMQGRKVFLTAERPGKTKMTVVCDGVKLRWWNDTSYLERAAPESLANLDAGMKDGFSYDVPLTLSASTALRLFADPGRLNSLQNVQDRGARTVTTAHGKKIQAHDIESFDGDCRRKIAFASDTHLPLSFSSDDDGIRFTMSFDYPAAAKKVDDSVFSAKPPAGLALYQPELPPKPVPALEKGTAAPALTGSGLEGKTATVAFESGPTLLVFTTAWAYPCKTAEPQIAKIAADLSVSHVRFVRALPVDEFETLTEVREYLQTHALPDKSVDLIDDGSLAKAYHVSGYPAAVLIDAGGKVVRTWTGFSAATGDEITAAARPAPAR